MRHRSDHLCLWCSRGYCSRSTVSMSNLKSERKRKVIHSEGRTIIARVYHFLQEEYNFMKANNLDNCDLSPLANIRKRTAEATGISERTVTTILKEEKELPSSSASFTSPMKKQHKRRNDDSDNGETLDESLNCRKRWKNLKDQCRKEMKKNPNESEWPHFQKLKFIHHQFLAEDEEGDEDTTDEVFNSLDESIKRPKLGYTMRKKLLMNKRRTIDVDMNKLIDLVQSRDIIWNRQLKGHHNWYKLDESWKEISNELGVTRDEARLKWKYLRDQARKEVRKQGSEWEYLPKLQFLTNQFNDYEGNDTADDHFNQDTDFDTTADQSSSYYIEPTANDVSVKDDEFDEFDTKPIIMETDFYDDDDEAQKSAGNSNDTPEVAKDEDIGFFNSLIPHVKKLGPAKKLMLRMKIQELVYNTVYNET